MIDYTETLSRELPTGIVALTIYRLQDIGLGVHWCAEATSADTIEWVAELVGSRDEAVAAADAWLRQAV